MSQPTRSDVLKQIIDSVRLTMSFSDNESIVDGTKFQGDLGADSLDALEVTMEIEDEYDISISDDEMKKIITIGDAANLVCEKLGIK